MRSPWAWRVARIRKRCAYRAVVRKPEGNRPLGRSRRKWEYNIKVHLQEVGCSVDCNAWLQDRDRWRTFVNTVVNL
jgi:hypothetical protein